MEHKKSGEVVLTRAELVQALWEVYGLDIDEDHVTSIKVVHDGVEMAVAFEEIVIEYKMEQKR